MIRRSHVAAILSAPGLAFSTAHAQTCGNPWGSGPTGPTARYEHAAAYDTDRNRIILFGGFTGSSLLADTWEWTAAGPGGGGTWNMVATTGPSARHSAGMAYDSARHRIVLFGGVTATSPYTYSNQTWEWDGSAWTQAQPTVSPPAMDGSVLAYDSGRSRTVLIGNLSFTGQTWEYDGTTWAAQPATTPFVGTARYSMAYDASRSTMVLFGSYYGNVYEGIEVWERGAANWILIQQSTFPYSSYAPPRASYDPVGQRILVIDAHEYNGAARVWSWGGPQSAWSRLSGAGPLPLAYGSAIFDVAGGQFVMMGGFPLFNGPASNRVDLYRPTLQSGPAIAGIGERSLRLELGGPTATLGAVGLGSGSITYQWRLNGVNLTDGGGFSGVTTPQLTIDPNDGAHSGYYDAVVTDGCGPSVRPETYVVISCYANCDGSSAVPILNAEDFQCFLNMYASATGLTVAEQIASYGNCDHSTTPPVLNVNDFQCFMNAYAARCP